MPDREKVIKGLNNIGREIVNTIGHGEAVQYLRTIDDAIALLKEQKKQKFFVDSDGKITPLPVVVRCKDCRWGDRSRNGKGEEMILCYNGDTGIEDGYLHEPDWFCAEGERKDS